MAKKLTETIKKQIQDGSLTMRSTFSIWAEKLGIGSGAILLLLVLIFITGSIVYWITSNSDLLIENGRLGIVSFFESFPYMLVLFFGIFFVLLSALLRSYDLSYKKPFIFIVSLVFGGALMLGWASQKSSMGKAFYHQQGRRMHMGKSNSSNAVFGTVLSTSSQSIVLQIENSEKTPVYYTSQTHFPFGKPVVGDEIRAIGTRSVRGFEAYGIRVFRYR
jgi:hypothetical protein